MKYVFTLFSLFLRVFKVWMTTDKNVLNYTYKYIDIAHDSSTLGKTEKYQILIKLYYLSI